MTTYRRFYANMDWWEVSEQPTKSPLICKYLGEVKKYIDCDDKTGLRSLSGHLRAMFLLQNIANAAEIFDFDELGEDSEIPAQEISLVAVDFSAYPIPLCKSEAYFLLPVSSKFTDIDLAEWQERNGFLFDAITFYWDFDDIEATGLDLSFGNHSGVECIVIE